MPEEYELAFSSRPGAMVGPQDPTTQEEVAVDMPRANGTSEAVQPLTGAGGERGPRTAMGGDGERGARLSPALERCFWLSVCSIIFGCSCVGIYALVNAVRARESYKRGRVEEATNCRKKAVKFSAISFVTYILSIALVLGLIVLVSYLVRLAH